MKAGVINRPPPPHPHPDRSLSKWGEGSRAGGMSWCWDQHQGEHHCRQQQSQTLLFTWSPFSCSSSSSRVPSRSNVGIKPSYLTSSSSHFLVLQTIRVISFPHFKPSIRNVYPLTEFFHGSSPGCSSECFTFHFSSFSPLIPPICP